MSVEMQTDGAPAGSHDGPLSRPRLIAYSSLAVPLILAEIPVLTFLPAFYARERALEAGAVGTIFLCARAWDGLLDILVGWLSDRTRSRFGRRRPWVVAGTPLLMLFAWLLCSPPPGAGLVYMLVCLLLFYSAYSLIKVPYWSWGLELADSYDGRNRIASFREAGTMIGVVLISVMPMLFLRPDPPLGDVLRLIAIGISGLVPVTAVCACLLVAERRGAGMDTHSSLREMIASVASNRPMVRFLAVTGSIYLGIGACNALVVFLIDVALGLPGKIFALALIQYAASLTVTPLIGRVGRRIDKHHLLAGGVALQIAAFVLAALVPASGSLTFAGALFVLLGIGFAGIYVLPLSMIADIADMDEARGEVSRSGGYVAAFNLTSKLGAALGLGIAFWVLDLVGFRPADPVHSAAGIERLRWAGFGLAAALMVPAVLLLVRHPVTREAQMRRRQQLAVSLQP